MTRQNDRDILISFSHKVAQNEQGRKRIKFKQRTNKNAKKQQQYSFQIAM